MTPLPTKILDPLPSVQFFLNLMETNHLFHQLDYSLTQYRSTGLVLNILKLTELCFNKDLKSFCITVYAPKYNLTISVEVFVDNEVDGQFFSQQS